MFPRHHETNPYFSPVEMPSRNQDASEPSSSLLPGMKQPPRQQTRRRPEDHYPLHAHDQSPHPQRTRSGPEDRYPLHAHDQDPHPRPKNRSEQVLEPRDRARGPSRAMVPPLPEAPDYPNHYPPHGKGSLHSPLPGETLPLPPRQGKSRKNRVQWAQQPRPQPESGDEQADPAGRSARPVPLPGPNESQEQGKRRQRLTPNFCMQKALTWLIALCCALFWIVIIVGGLIVLIVYLVFRPHIPQFNIASASLNAAYLDVDYFLNLDLTLLANFTNPNRKVRVDFSYVILDLYYGSVPIATQYIEPFSAMRSESKLASVHMISSQVRLPPNESQRLSKQIESNGPVLFEVKGLFRARSNLGSLLRYSYPLHGHCFISLTGPPSGVLRASRCKTKR